MIEETYLHLKRTLTIADKLKLIELLSKNVREAIE